MLANLFAMQPPPAFITSRLLRVLQVKVTNTTVTKKLLNHPDYPSLLSINDALREWKIHTIAARLPKKSLAQLPLPFVAHIYKEGEHFVLVTDATDNRVQYVTDEGKKVETTSDSFAADWSGVALLAEKEEGAGEKDYILNRRRERWTAVPIPAVTCFLLLLTLLAVVSFSSVFPFFFVTGYALLLVFGLAGIGVTALLLWYEIDKANPALQKICTAGTKTNCHAVLSSKSAKLLPWLSWSEVGFFYFGAGFAGLLIAGFVPSFSLLSLVVLLTIPALPYVLFSLYYQWRVAKQWCVLCLSVQALLLLQAGAALATGLLSEAFTALPSVTSILILAFSVIAVAGMWYLLKPLLLKGEEGKQSRHELARLKANPQIWEALLAKQKKIEYSTEGLGIVLGNPNASNTLVKVCNPYCGPCAKAHPEIEKLLEENDNVKVQIIFMATNHEKDMKAPPVKHLLAIAEKGNKAITEQALNDWYLAEVKDYTVFATKYPMNGELKQQDAKIEAMRVWCDEMKIAFTPTVFINDHQLPEVYNIPDIKYFLQ